MPGTLVLDLVTTVQESLELKVERAFRSAGAVVMPPGVEAEIKLDTEIEADLSMYPAKRAAFRQATIRQLRTLTGAIRYWVGAAVLILLFDEIVAKIYGPLTSDQLTYIWFTGLSLTFVSFLVNAGHNSPYRWFDGLYNLVDGTFAARSLDGRTEIIEQAPPEFCQLTSRIAWELSEVEGVEFRFFVKTFWIDPIGFCEITAGNKIFTRPYYAWLGEKRLWPPPKV